MGLGGDWIRDWGLNIVSMIGIGVTIFFGGISLY
jgi:hypothetical protein